MKNPIYPCLWFNGNAKEAADFYCSVFPNAKITVDTPMVVNFEINGRKFMGLNGGPNFKFNEAVSFVIECANQKEIDHYWDALTKDGEESMCGWLKDKYGVSWQVIPANIGEIMSHPEHGERSMQALLKMRKLDIATLENA
jgi:predicted 3-demethylubiquinone-9 3-methyltransferase (glyoxalase superfamily)